MPDLIQKIETIANDLVLRQLIREGPVTRIYLCTFEGIESVMRLDKPVAGQLGLNRAAEYDLLESIQSHGFSPQPLYSDPDEGILVCRYIKGEALSQADMHQTPILIEVARITRSIHKLEPVSGVSKLTHFLNHYEAQLSDHRLSPLLRSGMDLFAELNQETTALKLCHNDLNHSNFVSGNNLFILDWEYASLNDPYFDLATIIEYHQLSDSKIEEFINHYSQNSESVDIKKLDQWRQLTDYLSIFWLMMLEKYATMSGKEKAWMINLEKCLSKKKG